MDKRRSAVGANKFNATVEEQIAEERRKDAKVDQAERADIIEHDRLPIRDLQRHPWQQQYRAATRSDGEKGQGMDCRPQSQNRDIKGVNQKRNDKP